MTRSVARTLRLGHVDLLCHVQTSTWMPTARKVSNTAHRSDDGGETIAWGRENPMTEVQGQAA